MPSLLGHARDREANHVYYPDLEKKLGKEPDFRSEATFADGLIGVSELLLCFVGNFFMYIIRMFIPGELIDLFKYWV